MGRLLDGLIGWSIHNRLVVLLSSVALVGAGIYAASQATLDVLPDFTPPRVVVQTEAPGMGAADVEELVTRPIEQVLLGTPQTTSVRSNSIPGLSVITLMFEDGLDIYRARQLAAERMELARARLPQSVRSPQMAPISAPIGALLKFCVTSSAEDQAAAARAMRTFGEWTLRPRLLALSGVSQVTVHGGDVERFEVRANPQKLRQYGIQLNELVEAIRAAQSIGAAGFIDVGDARIDVQNDARLGLSNADSQLGETVVAYREGLPVRISDVSDVVRSREPRFGAAVYDGRPAIYLQVNKLPWADTLAVTHEVELALHRLERELPQGAKFEPPVFRQADFVETSLRSVLRAMGIGALLVVAVLILFLRSGRLAAISLTAIPLSVLSAVAVLVGLGVSINGMTLGGLAIAVGEVVDDAIVDVENVWRRLRENARLPEPKAPLEVIREASREIRASVVYATFIVGLVLVPVLLLGGVAGRIFSPLAQAYALAIFASLGVALTVTPAMCAWLLPRLATPESSPTPVALWLLARYRTLLRKVVEHPRVVFPVVSVVVAGALGVLPFIGGRFLPEFHENSLIAHVHAVPGTSLEEATRLAARLDTQARPSVAAHIASRIGRAELDEDAAPVNRMEVDLMLKPDEGRGWDQVVLDVATRIGKVPGLGFVVEGFLGERVHEILAGETAPVVVKVIGPDLSQLRALASQVARLMEKTPGFGTIRVEPQIDVAQLRVRPDRVALARYGVRPVEIADEVAVWLQGKRVAQVLGERGRVVELAIAGPTSMNSRQQLADIPISTHGGGSVALASLATLDDVSAPVEIRHENGERRISIGADALGASLSGSVAALEKKLDTLHLGEGYRIEVGGEAVARRQAASRLLLLGALVLLGIFLLLVLAFRSAKDAGITLLNLPLGLVGGVIAALLSPEGLSVAGLVGFVTLFGIISRNGIMLVSHKRHLDETEPQQAPVERVLRAAEERLLPILMTAITAGLGLLPLALSFEASGSELEAPMALIVCGGLITSTALNMLVIPTLYVWLARRRSPAQPAHSSEASP